MKNIKKIVLFLIIAVIMVGIATYFINNDFRIIYSYDNPYRKSNPFLSEENVSFQNKYVIPGGQTIGVELKTKGILVVGLADVVSNSKISVSPAKQAGIEIGDKIIAIDGNQVSTTNGFIEYVNENGIREYNLEIERDSSIFQLKMVPVKRYNTDEIIFGFWARDNIAGIGTITYIDPETCDFSAVAHGITDSDTNELIDIESGTISRANITNIKSGKRGEPGEIVGFILKDNQSLGKINDNTPYGIKGTINESSLNYFSDELIELGSKDEIQEGAAVILASIEDEIKEYNIEIIKLYNQNRPSNKSFVVKITDKKLLSLTNGIIQGMSGCPVIQNGKIVGAITHVFMKDPTKGYGIYIDWLIYDQCRNKSNI